MTAKYDTALRSQGGRLGRDRVPLGPVARAVQHLEIPLLIRTSGSYRDDVIDVHASQVRGKLFRAPRARPGPPPG